VRTHFPMSAVVGQEDLKLALLLVAIDPTIGGVLIRGERGTGKSTAARALAALLPEENGRTAPFVELPLGATEERIVGALDVAKVLKDGRNELRPGLLAQADGGVLYVDEVNLLPDHIVDLLLDSAASGWVTVEREGLSARQAARFVLIGTMNPEEGDLRPQFLDRFGLCVDVRGLDDAAERIRAVRQRMAFDDAPASVLEAASAQERTTREALMAARTRLKQVRFSDAELSLMAELAREREALGIRGDLAGMKSARALAAWEGSESVEAQHVRRIADLALTHRVPRRPRGHRRDAAPSAPPGAQRPTDPKEIRSGETNRRDLRPQGDEAPPEHAESEGASRRIDVVTDRRPPDSSMQASRQPTGALGRVIGTRTFDGTAPLAVRDTVVAAASRPGVSDLGKLQLQPGDLRQQHREREEVWQVLFLVDGSGSMAAGRLQAAKEVALGLLASNYQRRDEVALMIFRGEGAELVLPFTRDSRRLEDTLRDIAVGGRTPLASALHEAARTLRNCPSSLLVLFTDGRANVSVGEGDPWDEALSACAAAGEACAGALVIDCETGPIALGRARVLAEALRATYLSRESADINQVVVHLQGHLRPT
jgi:magnesium chelatase subunit D